MTSTKAINDFVDREFARETAFLAELVKVPSDNPPGDCRAHAQRARELLEQLGLTVEAHEVPRSTVEAAGMKSVTNLIVRHRFGEGPVIANPVGVHVDLVRHGETGFLATTPAEWIDAVRRLAADPDLRRRMGVLGRWRVESEFSVEVGGRNRYG